MEKKLIAEFVTTLIQEDKIFKSLADNKELIFQAIKHGVFPLVEMPAEKVQYDSTAGRNPYTGDRYRPSRYLASPVSKNQEAGEPYMLLDTFIKEIEAKGFESVKGTTRFSIDGEEFQITWDYGDGDFMQTLVQNAVNVVTGSEAWRSFYEEFTAEADIQLGDSKFFEGTNIPKSVFTEESGRFFYEGKLHLVINRKIALSFDRENIQLEEHQTRGVVVDDTLYWIDGGNIRKANFPISGGRFVYLWEYGFAITSDCTMLKVRKGENGEFEVISRQLDNSRNPIRKGKIFIVGSDVVDTEGNLVDFPELADFTYLYDGFSKFTDKPEALIFLERGVNGRLYIEGYDAAADLLNTLENGGVVIEIGTEYGLSIIKEYLNLIPLFVPRWGRGDSLLVLNPRKINTKKGTLTIKVPKKLIGLVIGKGGENIKSLTNQLADKGVKHIKVVDK